MTDAELMWAAIRKCEEGIAAGQTPFGAAIARGGRLVVAAHNVVWKTCDPTAHAEVGAIRQAAAQLATIDLTGCVMATTCEPCVMCLAAIHWARIDRVVFGASIADAAAAGFNELHLPAKEIAKSSGSRLIVEDGLLTDECRALFAKWKSGDAARTY